MIEVDAMSPGLRACVHEFGFTIVEKCLDAGVTEPRNIRDLVTQIMTGPRSAFENGTKDTRGGIANTLDALLLQAGASTTAPLLIRFLWSKGYTIVPWEPSNPMIEASLATVTNHDIRVTKREKHVRRLRAAIRAAAKRAWPGLTVS